MTKTDKLNRLRFLTIVLFLFIFTAGIANAAFSEPAAEPEKVISDAISPMKLEIDLKTDNITETKTVVLTNTGETATEYICRIEQTGGKNELAADFVLSESKITLLSGESKKLEIEMPVKKLKTNPADAEYKLKIIRNPKTQTPVGYIIPIKIIEKGPDSKTDGRKSGAGIGLPAAAREKEPENKTEIENENKNKSAGDFKNTHSADAGPEEKRNENNIMKKSGSAFLSAVLVMLAFLIMIVSIAGAVIIKKKKRKD
ncbi:MAG: hypothetical protein LBU81_07590 [Methanosarcinales archaeon]|nr:hypothetical protein [Methanosarcinales archaeon]